MRRKELFSALGAVAVIAIAALVWVAPWQGEPAPNVTFTTLDGERVELAELSGPVLIAFWATTCPGCVAEIPHLKNLYQELGPQGLTVVGVAMSYDPPNQVAAMVADREINYPIALDADGSISQAFGDIRLTPTTVLIDPNGRIAWRRMGELDMDRVHSQIGNMLSTVQSG